MAKINATYSSGYYISPDTDFRRLEEQQQKEKRNQRKRGRDGEEDAETIRANTKRQTFAIPFDLYCEHCERRIPRGAHVYTNRRATRMKYLNAIRIWELEIRCQYCSGLYYLQTDPETAKETGGYKCVKGCRRAEGDFLAINAKNEAARAQWEKEKAEAEANPLAALERENEASRALAERNRRIEEDVLARADADDDESLLAAMQRRRREQQEAATAARQGPSAGGLPLHALSAFSSSSKYTFDGRGADDGEDDGDGAPALTPEELAAEEAAYEQFEAEMQARWQAAQEAAARHAALTRVDGGTDATGGGGHSWFSGDAVREAEHTDVLATALARYGGGSSRRSAHPRAADTVANAVGKAEGRHHAALSATPATPSSSSSSPPAMAALSPAPTESRRNAFVASDSESGSDAEGDTGKTAAPPPPSRSGRNGKKSSLLSRMFADEGDD